MPSQPTVDLLFSFTHWQNKAFFFSKGPFFLYNWITVWKVYKTWFFFQISNLELSYYVEIPSKTWCIFQHSRSKWKEKLLTYSSLNTSKEQQNYDVKIRAYFSLYNLGWWRDVKLSFYDGSNTSLPHWGVKIDTVWPDQVASVYEWPWQKGRRSFFHFVFTQKLDDDPFLFLPWKNIHKGSFHSKKHLNFWKNIWCISSLELWTLEFSL